MLNFNIYSIQENELDRSECVNANQAVSSHKVKSKFSNELKLENIWLTNIHGNDMRDIKDILITLLYSFNLEFG